MPPAAAPSGSADLGDLGPNAAQRSRGNRRHNPVEDLEQVTSFLIAELTDPFGILPDCLPHHIALRLREPGRSPPETIDGLRVKCKSHFNHTRTILPYSSPVNYPGNPGLKSGVSGAENFHYEVDPLVGPACGGRMVILAPPVRLRIRRSYETPKKR